MRKVLLFLALFGIGLAVLLLVRQRLHRPPAAPDHPARPVTEGQFTKIPLPPEKTGEQQAPLEFVQRGAIDVTEFAGKGNVRKPVRTLHADDSKSLGNHLYVLFKLVLRELDPDTGDLTAQVTSPRTRLKIELVGARLQLGEAERAVLTDAEATIYKRAAITPLTLKVPLLEWQISANRWVSDRPVDLSGSGLQAHGEGLEADLENGTVVLPRSGRIELTLPGGTRAVLHATRDGPIEMASVREEGEDLVRINVTKGARLSASGEELSRLDAEELRLLARAGAGADRGFTLRSVEANGQVVAESRGDTFRADHAVFRLAPGGRLEHADLDGAVTLESAEGKLHGAKAAFDFQASGRPDRAHIEQDVVMERGEDRFSAQKADFVFAEDGKLATAKLVGNPVGKVAIGRYLRPGETEFRSAHPEISGAGPLEVDFARGTFRLAGPGDLKAAELDLELHADQSLEGGFDPEGRAGDLTADGAVTLRWKGDDLSSRRVRLATSTLAEGEPIVEAQGFGPTTVHHKGEDGAILTIVAEDGLEARKQGDRLLVPLARGVRISTTGPEEFEARAGIVRDFDWTTQSFTAEGDVQLEGTSGRGSAERVVAKSAQDLELTGSPGRPARYAKKSGKGVIRFEEASVQGLSIHARENTLDATGEVRLDFAAARETYHLQASEVHVAFGPPESAESGSPRPFEARASSGVRAQIETSEGGSSLACDRLRVVGVTKGSAGPDARPNVTTSEVQAEGSVVVDWRARVGVSGEGDLFTLDPSGRGRLSALPGKRVRASGRMAGDTTPYSLQADWFEFERDRLEARGVELETQPQAQDAPVPAAPRVSISRMSADHLLVTAKTALLEGNAHVDGRTRQDEPWEIDAGSVRIDGAFDAERSPQTEFELVQATGGFRARLGTRATASGQTLEGRREKVRLEGEPAELLLETVAMRSAWIEYDAKNMLLATDKGEIGPPKGQGDWTIDYESLQPFEREDKSILALRNPVYSSKEIELRALWMLFWIDREQWRRSGGRMLSETATGTDLRVERADAEPGQVPGARPARPPPRTKIGELRAQIAKFMDDPNARILSEVYVEGNIELTEKGERVARASAVYLDFVEGHGWVRDADVLENVDIRGKRQSLRVRAEWMRVSADLSLRADRATLTFCGYDEPHYVVETGDLRLKPNGERIQDFDVSATKNTLRFQNGWAIPLPPLIYAEDEEGNPIIDNISLGNSAKFGASVGASFNLGLGKIGRGLGGMFSKMLSLPKNSMKGHWRFDGDYLGSRGVMLGTGLELRSGDKFKLDADFSFIPDRGEDKGLVRVPEDDRSLIRNWFRTRGRYTVTKHEWFDLAASWQSDPAVQSEFFERDYLRYEQKDTYLHWRKAADEWYFSSTVKVRIEDRTDIEELPTVGAVRGRAPVGRVFGLDLLYTGSLDAGYLRRREGDPAYYPGFPDGLGDREVARADTEQRIEAPFALGFAGLRATPWVSARLTAWDRGVDPDQSPTRATALVGFDLSTTFWKRYGGGYLNTISPFASVHGDVATYESDGDPVSFDRTEAPIDGKFVDAGLRTRVWKPGSLSRFDAEVRASHGSDLPNGAPDGFQPVAVLGELLTGIGSLPVGLTHDGRYDVETNETVYSRSFLGFRVLPNWGIEFGYHRGLSTPEYEAFSAATRYRASDKWEVELGETISVLDDDRLGTTLVLRRIGHDFVTEIEAGYTAGEGTSFSINLTPFITWRPGGIGLLDRWLRD